MADEKKPLSDRRQEVLVESEQLSASTGFQVCIKLNDEQRKLISELVGEDCAELRINVDELSDLASVIAN